MFVRRMQPFGAQRALGNDLAQTEGVAPERLAVLHRVIHLVVSSDQDGREARERLA